MGIFINIFSLKTKKLLLKFCITLVILILLSPYGVGVYVKLKYDKAISLTQNFMPNVKITSDFKLGYFTSLLFTEIQLNHSNNLTENKKITLQHEINSKFYKKLIATITTRILHLEWNEVQDFLTLEQLKNFQLITTMKFNQDIASSIKQLSIQHNINNSSYKFNNNNNNNINITLNQINLFYNNEKNELLLLFYIPKLIYIAGADKLEIENLDLKFNAKNIRDHANRQVNLSTVVDKLYLINRSKPILRLSNFNVEQELGKELTSNLSFAKLNVMERKFGPLLFKWQLKNFYLSQLLDKIDVSSFSVIKEKINNYNIDELRHYLLKNQPNLSIDLSLQVENDKLKILSDVIVNSNSTDWFTTQDLLDSLNINIAAKLPKNILFDLISIIVREEQKKINRLQLMYNPNNKNNRNLPKAYISKDPKEAQKELENLIYKKIAYLMKNNIIIEQQDGFSLDLCITEGTFYSRMNPFNVFSFQ